MRSDIFVSIAAVEQRIHPIICYLRQPDFATKDGYFESMKSERRSFKGMGSMANELKIRPMALAPIS